MKIILKDINGGVISNRCEDQVAWGDNLGRNLSLAFLDLRCYCNWCYYPIELVKVLCDLHLISCCIHNFKYNIDQ